MQVFPSSHLLVSPLASQPGAGLGVALALLTLFVGGVVTLFSRRYLRADRRPGRYFAILGALVATVLVLLLTGNLIVLGVAWCASGWLLSALIGHVDNWDEAAAAARHARAHFMLGDAALLAALAILGDHAGSVQLPAVLDATSTLPSIAATLAALLLVVAAAARCALPPLSGWLLSSMTAPTPVSALMHAGLVNAGGFVLIRFAPVLEAAPLARAAAVTLGMCGALYGIGVMLVRPDVKRALAGSTVSQMGFMIMSCGLGAYAAALWHIIAHGLFKAWLFLGSASTIGTSAARATVPLSGRTALGIAVGTLGVALALAAAGEGGAALVPLMLGFATASATLIGTLGGQVPPRAKATIAAALAGLVAFHAGGLGLADLALGPRAVSPAPAWVSMALLALFLGTWAWQQRRLTRGLGLPLPLYVRLINAGTLPMTARGDAK